MRSLLGLEMRGLFLIVALVMALSFGCKGEESSSEKQAEKEEPEPAQVEKEQPVEEVSEPKLEFDRLAWQDSMRVVHTGLSFLVLELCVGEDATVAKDRRVLVARSLGFEAVEPAAFRESMTQLMLKEVRKYRQTSMGESITALEQALQALGGEGEFVKNVISLRDAVTEIKQAGMILELLHTIQAVKAGDGLQGCPAFGVRNGLICPDASWLSKQEMATSLSQGQISPHLPALEDLKACLHACPGVAAAADIELVAEALSSCEAVEFLPVSGSGWRNDSLEKVLGLLTVGQLLALQERYSAAELMVESALVLEVQSALQSLRERLALSFSERVDEGDLPTYTMVSESQKVFYTLEFAAHDAKLGVSPFLEIAGKGLSASSVLPNSAKELTRLDVNLEQPTTLRRYIKNELPRRIGLVPAEGTLVSRLQAALKATRAVGLSHRLLAVKVGGQLRWLPIDSELEPEADVLIQDTGNELVIWYLSSELGMHQIRNLVNPDNWVGRREVIAFEGSLTNAAVAVAEQLMGEVATKVVLDIQPNRTIEETLAFLDRVDTGGAAAGADAKRRFEQIFFTEYSLGVVPAKQMDRPPGVSLDERGMEVAGPLPAKSVMGAMEGLLPSYGICYRKVLEGDPTVEGRVLLQASIDTQGKVIAVTTVENTTGNEDLQACAEDGVSFLKFTLPVANSELSVLKVPVYFKLPQEETLE